MLRHSRSQDLGGQPGPAYGEQSEFSQPHASCLPHPHSSNHNYFGFPIWLAPEVFHLADADVVDSIVKGRGLLLYQKEKGYIFHEFPVTSPQQ